MILFCYSYYEQFGQFYNLLIRSVDHGSYGELPAQSCWGQGGSQKEMERVCRIKRANREQDEATENVKACLGCCRFLQPTAMLRKELWPSLTWTSFHQM